MSRTSNGSASSSPTYRPQGANGLTPVLDRNITALHSRRQRELDRAGWQERMADRVTAFTGSMPFVYIHLVIFGIWIVANLGWLPYIPRWDPTFVALAMVASVEAIFLSTFVLISQNRMAAAADKRADLDLQISLLTEHEITKLADLVSEIAKSVGVRDAANNDIEEIKRDVAPDAVLDRIEKPSKARH